MSRTKQEAKADMSWILMLLRDGERLSAEELDTLKYFFEKGIDAEFRTETDKETNDE